MAEKLDDKQIRCRRLGHEVPLRYCRTQEGHTVCPQIRNCWWQFTDIDTYLQDHLSSEELAQLVAGAPSTPRLAKII